uniref:Uncharacterized protein n=1 Tax=Minutocellus polymorphus TaxID=265543 RepID=A0A7S0FR12_9STRA|mmetsp:Transcript_6264/g.10455  ORF Transcript_6264/g.10455 Transcript_6264/m.10455 type:complete len:215 (+) Transcript_6264:110-754(+)
MAGRRRIVYTKKMVLRALLLLSFVQFVLILSFEFLDPFGSDKPHPSSTDEHDCITGSTGLDWCPELKQCIQPWGQTCPIKASATFSGGTRLSCSKGRCAAPEDNKCSWSDGVVTYATYYWTDRNGHFTIPKGCAGIKCSGCHLSEIDSWLDRWRMYLWERYNHPHFGDMNLAMDAIGFLLIIVASVWFCCRMHRTIPRRIRHAIRRRVRPALDQ